MTDKPDKPDTPSAREQTTPWGCLGLFVAWIVVTLALFYGVITNRGALELAITAVIALVIVGVAYGAWGIGRKLSG